MTDWVAKKPATYCRPHGLRIIGVVNGVGWCRRCTDDVVTELSEMDEYGEEDWCECYQKVGEPPHVCERHAIMLEGV